MSNPNVKRLESSALTIPALVGNVTQTKSDETAPVGSRDSLTSIPQHQLVRIMLHCGGDL